MFAFSCPACDSQTICDLDAAVVRLRRIGFLRRDDDPDAEFVRALLEEQATRLTCPQCKAVGIAVGVADAEWDDDAWQTAVVCEICRTPIPPERIEILPDTKRCVGCQGDHEAGRLDEDELEFCPRCGAVVEIRVSQGGGMTRYKRFCTGSPPCRL